MAVELVVDPSFVDEVVEDAPGEWQEGGVGLKVPFFFPPFFSCFRLGVDVSKDDRDRARGDDDGDIMSTSSSSSPGGDIDGDLL